MVYSPSLPLSPGSTPAAGGRQTEKQMISPFWRLAAQKVGVSGDKTQRTYLSTLAEEAALVARAGRTGHTPALAGPLGQCVLLGHCMAQAAWQPP